MSSAPLNPNIADSNFIKNVGFDIIRDWLSEHSKCELNKHTFQKLIPKTDAEWIYNSHQKTQEIVDGLTRKDALYINETPAIISDTIENISLEGYAIQEKQAEQIYRLIENFLDANKIIKAPNYPIWSVLLKNKIEPKNIISSVNKIFNEKFEIKDNASKDMLRLTNEIDSTKKLISKELQKELQKARKNNWIHGDDIVYINERSSIPILVKYKNKIKGVIEGYSATKQTVFIEPLSVVALNNSLQEHYLEIKKEKYRILVEFTSLLRKHIKEIKEVYRIILHLDSHISQSLLAIKTISSMPVISKENIMSIKKSMNPIFTLNDKHYVPLTLSIKKGKKVLLISGPNSGGKTVILKSIGLYQIMFQSGLFIPAAYSEFYIMDTMFSDIGDHQSIKEDLSTFTSHTKNISRIIEESGKKSLVLIDEIGTGTDPEIGSALGCSILHELIKKGALIFCTTHLGPIKIWGSNNNNVESASMVFDQNNLEPTFEIDIGTPGSSYGIEIANRAGIKKDVINRAKKMIDSDTMNIDKLMTDLNKMHIETKVINEKNKTERADIKSIKEKMNIDIENLEKEKKEYKREALKGSQTIIESYRKEIESLIEKIKESNASRDSIINTKAFIEDSLEEVGKELESLKEDEQISYEISKGQSVQIASLNETGIVININIKKRTARIDCKNKKITVPIQDLIPNIKNKGTKNKGAIKHNIQGIESFKIDLRGKRVDAGIKELELFLDRATLSGLSTIHIIHGKGTGALQEAIHIYLKDSKYVNDFRFAIPEHGGTGLTIVEIK